MARESCGVVVLCGGESRRMGRAKAWLRFGPERLLQRVVRHAGRCGGSVVVVAGPSQELPELPPDVRLVRDAERGGGPLPGFLTGLVELPDRVEMVYLTAVDAPFLAEGWIDALIERADGFNQAVPRQGGFAHPLASVYRREPAIEAAEVLVAGGRLRLMGMVDQPGTRWIEEAELRRLDPRLDTLRNLNTPDDYRRALADAGFEVPELAWDQDSGPPLPPLLCPPI